jgi:phenylacetate-CoA ligase
MENLNLTTNKKTKNSISTTDIINDIKQKKSNFWLLEKDKNAIQLFHEAAERVPAYKDFLKKHKINHESIKTTEDLKSVPYITKDNYLKKYPLEKLCWDGTLRKASIFTSTSGSTGDPFYFCRSSDIDWQSSIAHELFFKNASIDLNASTLVLVCFGMGVWIGGIITYQAFELMGERGYPISILTPGINKEEIFRALKRLAPNFEQIVIAGYPPFVKDIIDEAPERGIKIKDMNVRFVFAAEAFTEKFRDYISKKVNIANPYLDTMNIYGSADIGTMAYETPLSILVRKCAVKKPNLFKSIFSDINKTPTLAQYNPYFISFDTTASGEILLTGDNSIPLVRYAIGDHGGTFSFSQLVNILADNRISLYKLAKDQGIENYIYQLPFVYIYERTDLSTTLYGLQVYPETIREVLLNRPFSGFLTGKLTLVSRYDKEQNQYLEINIELRKEKNISSAFKKALLSEIVTNLREKNSEYRELSNFLKGRASPRLIFWPAEHPEYFKPGIKQKWVR